MIWHLGHHMLVCGDGTSMSARATARDFLGDGYVSVLDPPFEMPARALRPLITDPSIVFGQAAHMRAIPDALWRFERVIVKRRGHRSATIQLVHEHALVAQVGSVRTMPADGMRSARSVVLAPEPIRHEHEKCASLIAEHLDMWTPPGIGVFDPFAGSGSSLVAAATTGRKALLYEIDEERCLSIVSRWQDECQGAAPICRGPNGRRPTQMSLPWSSHA